MYAKEYQTMSREEMSQLQIERLQSTLNRVYRNVAFYKNIFDENKIIIEDVHNIEDLQILPFTTKEDLRKSYPYDMFAVPLRDIVRIHSSSGTTGKPIVAGYTRNDIEHWSGLVARMLDAAGVDEHDFVQISFDYGLFTGGLGFHYGAEKLGASVIPASAHGQIEKQVYLMKDYKTSVLLSPPSFAIEIAAHVQEMGIHPDALNLKCGLFGSEPWSEEMSGRIQEKLHIKAFDTYGLSEIMGPGISFECKEQDGLHINEDHFIVEVIDPTTLEILPSGTIGELVITNITKEGCPLIRYRTGDLAALLDGQCVCGRTLMRMTRVEGRNDDMIIFRGAKVFPSQIEEVLMKAEGIKPNFRISREEIDGVDNLEIRIEVSEDILFDEIKKLMELESRVAKMLEDKLGITPKITLVEHKSL